MNEIWRPIIKENCKDFYAVSNFGNVKNVKTGKILSKSLRDGYYSVTIMNTNNTLSHKENIHILVAEHFIRMRKKGEVIDHVNNNKLDNTVDNLQIISSKENTIKAAKQLKCFSPKPINIYDLNRQFIEQMKNIEDVAEKYKISIKTIRKIYKGEVTHESFIFEIPEQFRSKFIDFEIGNNYKHIDIVGINGYVASKDGKIINATTKQILKPTVTNNGYHVVHLVNKNIHKRMLVHRLIATTFIEEKDSTKNIVNHKDRDKTNNNVDNLEWVTTRENIIHSKK